MKVYVVTQGEYSAYHIVGVTLDREKAERWLKMYEEDSDRYADAAQIEEFETDEFGANGMYMWIVDEDGAELNNWHDDDLGEWYCDNANFRVTVMARDKAHALKAAYDKIAMLKAEKEGLV